jgi:prolyl oligopeptidase
MNNKAIALDIPEDASTNGILNNQLIVKIKSDWTVNDKTYKTGTLISLNFTELLKGNKDIQVIIEPDEFSSISRVSTTKNKLLLDLLTNVTSQLYIYSFNNGNWSSQKVDAPDFGTISIVSTDDLSDQYFFNFQNFITPSTLYSANANDNTFKVYKSLPAFFDANNYEIKQFKAKSKDGTMIPYFMVASKDIKNDGTNPTLILAYGGFEISSKPFYASTYGTAWLEKGGVFVLANIRGGGEFGPKWHQDGLKEKRQNVFDDLYAVSEDLITKKITYPKHLGVMGGSNGGLLVGVAFTQRPDLYNAVVCEVPLLDMQRYNKLLAGASWMGEYGNPDVPEEWEYIKKYSPYQNLKEGMDYPEVYFGTSTRDDRVHPGHARKMVAKMNDMGYKTYYYENTEGGHAGSSTNEQSAKSDALTFSYLLMKLK